MRNILPLLFLLLLTACAEVELASHVTKQVMPLSRSQGTFKVGTPYKIEGQRYFPKESYDLVETGIASWYGKDFHGKKTANGETFDRFELTAAHRTLQMPSLVRVTNLANGRSLVVRVNDRGPYKKGRVMDLSERAAELLDFKSQGTAKVKLEVLKQESIQIAEAARSGQDTSGYEVALNRGGRMPEPPAPVMAFAPAEPTPVVYGSGAPPVVAVASETLAGGGMPVPGHTRNGAFYPDPVVTEVPVRPTGIYVQAGSFSVADNAYKLSAQLQSLARTDVYPAMVRGQQFYRVRVGPVGSVEQADALLARVLASGSENAILIVE